MPRATWHTIDDDPYNLNQPPTSPKLSFLQLNSGRKFRFKHLAWFVPFSPSLTHLDLSHHPKLDALDSEQYLSRFTNLTTLKLAACRSLSSDSLGSTLALKLTSMKILDLSNTKCSDPSVASWSLLNPKMTQLNLSRTSITFRALASISRFSGLSHLSLEGHSTFVDDSVQHLLGLTVLRTLNMSSCVGLTGKCIIDTIMYMTTLVQLSIDRFRVNDYELSHISRLTKLESLSFANCFEIDGSCLEPLSHSLSALQSLNMNSCDLDSQYIPHLENFSHSMLYLNLAQCRIRDETLKSIAHLENLTSLDLSRSDLTDKNLHLLNQLTHLQRLSLSHLEMLTNTGIFEIKKVASLTQLDISWNSEISDEAIYSLTEMPLLKYLDLAYCRSVSGKCLQTVYHSGIITLAPPDERKEF